MMYHTVHAKGAMQGEQGDRYSRWIPSSGVCEIVRLICPIPPPGYLDFQLWL